MVGYRSVYLVLVFRAFPVLDEFFEITRQVSKAIQRRAASVAVRYSDGEEWQRAIIDRIKPFIR
jgi:hypothetical protein